MDGSTGIMKVAMNVSGGSHVERQLKYYANSNDSLPLSK